MYWFNNLKIRLKLVLGFGIVIVLATAMGVFAISQVMNINHAYQELLDGAVEGRIQALQAEASIRSMRRTFTQTGMMAPTANAAVINDLYVEMRGFYGALNNALDDYDYSVVNDDGLTQAEMDYRLNLSQTVRALAYRYVYELAIPSRDLALAGDHGSILALRDATEGIINDLVANSTRLWELEAEEQVVLAALVVDSANQSTTILVAVIIAVVLVAIAIALVIAGIIVKPINGIVALVGDVSQGKLNVNTNYSRITKDEIGKLTTDIYGLVDTIKTMMEDLSDAQKAYMVKGDSKYQIDASKYQNSFKDIIQKTNQTYEEIAIVIGSAVYTFDQISVGNFDVAVHEEGMDGDWAQLPKATHAVIANLKNVNSEINAMIDSVASKGNLSFQIDELKYKGEWSKIMRGLNGITIAVDAPIKLIEVAMNEMKAGNFDVPSIAAKMTAKGLDPNVDSYKGVFNYILSSFVGTIQEIADYIYEISKDLAMIADGDMTTVITREFIGDFAPIKDSLNVLSNKLNNTLSEIQAVSAQVLSGATQISTSATELANGALAQASAVEELNATIDMVNQQTRQNADNATTASKLSTNTATNAHQGNMSMKEMLTAMSQIKESSSEISKVIKAIEDISFQTNLLALNASVEAARAGEHGKGFAVVADEVRSLAGRSSTSAAETNDLIATSVSRVESGSEIAQNTAVSLDAIVANVNEVSSIINTIATASQEQAEAIAQISEGLGQISMVTQSNSAVSEETAAASEELNSQAEVLRQLVTYFKLQ